MENKQKRLTQKGWFYYLYHFCASHGVRSQHALQTQVLTQWTLWQSLRNNQASYICIYNNTKGSNLTWKRWNRITDAKHTCYFLSSILPLVRHYSRIIYKDNLLRKTLSRNLKTQPRQKNLDNMLAGQKLVTFIKKSIFKTLLIPLWGKNFKFLQNYTF